jgi:Mor family transcriptional regulator
MNEEQQDMLGDGSFSADLLDHLSDIPLEVQKKWPRDLSALVDIYGAALKRLGYSESDANKISRTLLAEQSIYCGGRYFYLPKGDALKKAIRDVDLHRDWSERSMQPDDLAKKYNISLTHVYRIMKEQNTYYRKKIQSDLF